MNYDQIILFFDRPMIESGNVDKVVGGLNVLIENKESIEKYAGKVTFTFDGWNEDKRELYEISVVKNWLRKLTDRFPYWLVFLDRTNYCIPVLLTILLNAQAKIDVNPNLATLEFDSQSMASLLDELFSNMNELCEKHNIPDSKNRQWTKEIGDCLAAYTESTR